METSKRLAIEARELRQMGVAGEVAIFPRMITPAQDDLLDATSHLDVDELISSLRWMQQQCASTLSGSVSAEAIKRGQRVGTLIEWLVEVAGERN